MFSLCRPEKFDNPIDVAICYIRSEGSYLFLKRSPEKFEGGRYCTPGGHVEPSETPLDAAVRETFEETGIEVSSESFKSLGIFYSQFPERNILDHVFFKDIGRRPKVELSSEHTDYAWWPLREAPSQRIRRADEWYIKNHLIPQFPKG
jgi:8-oxo-dGTP pyrophosphatase MutT (NUDIX family)